MGFHHLLNGTNLHNSKVTQYSGNPNGFVNSTVIGEMCIDITNKVIYTSTAIGLNNWTIVGGSGDITTLSALNDVNISNRNNEDVLKWNGTDYDFEKNNVISAGTTNIPPTINYNSLTEEIELTSCEVYLYDNENNRNSLKLYTIEANNLNYITDTINYIVVNYNDGTPIYQNITNVDLINESNIIPIFTYVISEGEIHYIDWDSLGDGITNKLHMRLVKTERFIRESGLILTENSSQNVLISSGNFWFGAVRRSLTDYSSATNTFRFFYHNAGEWTYNDINTTYNNTQYDDGTNLQTLGNNKFVINWIYRCSCNENLVSFLLSNQYNSLAQAKAASAPTDIPLGIKNISFLTGRIIVKKNATSGEVESVFTQEINFTGVEKHNDLGELDSGDYQHLTLLEHNNLTSSTPTFNYVQYNPTQWTDLRAPATAINPPGRVSDPDFDNINGGYIFANGRINSLIIIFQMDHSWAIGTDINFHIHWEQANAGDPLWQLEYKWISNGELVPSSWTTITTTTKSFSYTSGTIAQICSFDRITPPANAGLSSIFKCNLSRLGDNDFDTYNDDLLFNEADVHFQIDYIGSSQEFIK